MDAEVAARYWRAIVSYCIVDYCKEYDKTCLLDDLPMYEELAREYSKRAKVKVYSYHDDYIGDQGVYPKWILDLVFNNMTQVKENAE